METLDQFGGLTAGDPSRRVTKWLPHLRSLRYTVLSTVLLTVIETRGKNAMIDCIRDSTKRFAAMCLGAGIALSPVGQTFGQAYSQDGQLGHGLEYIYGDPPAPTLDLPGFSSPRHRLGELTGKVVIVNFWTSWCPPCVEELPSLEQAYRAMKNEGLEVLAVNLGETETEIRRFLDRFPAQLSFPIVLSSTTYELADWEIKVLPMSYVINRNGDLVYRAKGPRDFVHPKIVAILRRLLDEGSS